MKERVRAGNDRVQNNGVFVVGKKDVKTRLRECGGGELTVAMDEESSTSSTRACAKRERAMRAITC